MSPIFRLKVDFLMKIAKSLHQFGISAHRIEQAVTLISERLKIEAQVASLPTSVTASFRDLENETTRVLRIHRENTDLTKMAAVDELGDQLIDGKISLSEADKKIDLLMTQKESKKFSFLFWGFSSFCVALLLNSSLHTLWISFLIGSFLGLLSENSKSVEFSYFFETLGAIIAAFFSKFTPEPEKLLLASVVILLPGYMLTMSISELSNRNLASGSARLMGALMTFMKLGFGAYLGYFLNPFEETMPLIFVPYANWFGLCLTPFAFSFYLNARKKDFAFIFLVCLLGGITLKTLIFYYPNPIAAMLASFVVGFTSNLYARLKKSPSSITLVPGLLLLVPGTFGLKATNLLLNSDTLEGFQGIFETFATSSALVSGLLIANVSFPSKRSL